MNQNEEWIPIFIDGTEIKVTIPRIDQVIFKVYAHPEYADIRGNLVDSRDNEYVKFWEDKVLEELDNGNIWAWCAIEVRASWLTLSASEYFGCASFSSKENFLESDYYEDMKKDTYEELLRKIKKLRSGKQNES